MRVESAFMALTIV